MFEKTTRFLCILLCSAISYVYASNIVMTGWYSTNEKEKGLLIIFGFAIHILTLCFLGFTLKKLFPVSETSPSVEIQATRF